MSKDEDKILSPEETFRLLGEQMLAKTETFKWAKAPTHIPPKRPVKVNTIELSDPTLRIATTPPPFKNTLN